MRRTKFLAAGQSTQFGDLVHLMHGRKNKERRDSVTEQILRDRNVHLNRIQNFQPPKRILQEIEKLGLGSKRVKHLVYQQKATSRGTTTAAGGHAVHVASACSDWPVFKHVLPEIAFTGHSNSGKSTLVNAMVGVKPNKGPASVSERAGWTDQICFYQLGKRPPILTLVDLPGYGHAVASSKLKKAWVEMSKDYVSSRPVLSLCCILVDSTRGLCNEDYAWIRFLQRRGVPWQVILSKGDLLSVVDLASSLSLVESDLQSFIANNCVEKKKGSTEQVESIDRNHDEDANELEVVTYESDENEGGHYDEGQEVTDRNITRQEWNAASDDLHKIDTKNESTTDEDASERFDTEEELFDDEDSFLAAVPGALPPAVTADVAVEEPIDCDPRHQVPTQATDNDSVLKPRSRDDKQSAPSTSSSWSRRLVIPLCASTGAGISSLWAELKACAWESSTSPGSKDHVSTVDTSLDNSFSRRKNGVEGQSDGRERPAPAPVREHIRAHDLRRLQAARLSNKNATIKNGVINRL